MKILWIYNQHHPSVEYDHWLHMHFAEYFNKIEGMNLKAYGINLHNYSFSIPYKSFKQLKDIYKEYEFDVVIVNTKGRCYDYYNPFSDQFGEYWLPADFSIWNKTPKIMIEEDYQYEKNNLWYIESGFDILINRHYSNHLKAEAKKDIKCIWLPFSVDINTFKPRHKVFNNQVCFIGNYEHEIYEDRRKVMEILSKEGLGYNYGPTITHEKYINKLGSYTVGFCGVTNFNLTPSKIFEIIASGSVLLINNPIESGVNKLFQSDEYETFKPDYSDLVNVTKNLLENADYRNAIAFKGLKAINEKHTHEIRIKELIEKIKKI